MNYPMRLPSLKIFLVGFLVCCHFIVSAQYQIPEKPKTLYPVYDEAGLLTETEKQTLNDKLIKFEDSTSTEIEVIIIPSTKGEDVNFLATQFGEKWGIGKKNIDNGKISLRRSQLKLADSGNCTMNIWLGKQYLGQTDKVESDNKNTQSINFIIESVKK